MMKSVYLRFGYLAKLIPALPVLFIAASTVSAQTGSVLLRSDGSSVSSSVSSDARLKSLRSDLHPGIYLSEGETVRREQEATTLFTDMASLPGMDKAVFATKSIEMVTILLDDPSELTSFIDLTPFNGYPILKYIQVRASFPCSTDQLHGMLKNAGGQYLLLLNVDPVN